MHVCITVHNGMLAAALGTEVADSKYSPEITYAIREEKYQAAGSTYPAWYLFGSEQKNVCGLVELYRRQGCSVSLCPESSLGPPPLVAADMYDVLLCSVSPSQVAYFRDQSTRLCGYLDDRFSSKSTQASLFGSMTSFLPRQSTYTSSSEPVLPDSDTGLYIIKGSLGAGRISSSGLPHTVWKADKLKQELPSVIKNTPAGMELIIGEFLITRDPFAGFANHVVHKMHFSAERSANITSAKPYGVYCQKIIHHVNLADLDQHGFLTLERLTGKPQHTVGRIDTIQEFTPFSSAFDNLPLEGRIIFSADFMLPPDGIPRFLELNKLAGTFAEAFDPELPPVIDAYPLH